jgi:hypothetical protein
MDTMSMICDLFVMKAWQQHNSRTQRTPPALLSTSRKALLFSQIQTAADSEI